MNLVNLTPHEINVCDTNGTTVRFIAPSGEVARVAALTPDATPIDGIPTVTRSWGDVSGLPVITDDTVFIVSSLVLAAVPNRHDVVAPDTGATAIRNEDGQIVGVTRFVRN